MVARKQAGRFDQAELDRKMNLLEEDYKGYFEKKCVNLDKALKLQCFKVKNKDHLDIIFVKFLIFIKL